MLLANGHSGNEEVIVSNGVLSTEHKPIILKLLQTGGFHIYFLIYLRPWKLIFLIGSCWKFNYLLKEIGNTPASLEKERD